MLPLFPRPFESAILICLVCGVKLQKVVIMPVPLFVFQSSKKVPEVSYRVVTGLFGQYSRRIVCQRVACSRVAGGMDSVQSQCCVYVTVPASAPETARVDIPARANGTRTANRCVCDSRFLER